MVSSNKAGLDLRETPPLSRNILHAWSCEPSNYSGQQMNPMISRSSKDDRHWLWLPTSTKVEASHLIYLASIWDSAKSGLGRIENRHLNYLAEFIFVNLGGFYREVSSPPMNDRSVGGVIVVGARESRVHGEGR